MAVMAARTGIPIATIKYAKRNGCMFIHHDRCRLGEFLKWFFNRAEPDENTDWVGRDKRAGALMKEIRLEMLKGNVVDFATVDRIVRDIVSNHFFGELQRLTHEFPGSLKGKNEVAIAVEVGRQIEAIKAGLNVALETWEKTARQNEESDATEK